MTKLRIFKHITYLGKSKVKYIPLETFSQELRVTAATYMRHAILSSYTCLTGITAPPGMGGLLPTQEEITNYFNEHKIIGIEYVKDGGFLSTGVLELFAVFDSEADMAVYVLGHDKYLESIHE